MTRLGRRFSASQRKMVCARGQSNSQCLLREGARVNHELQNYFPVLFVLGWLGICTLLAALSGWFRLMASFPNQEEQPILRIRGQSGMMGTGTGVRMRRILTLSVCPSGLRVGIMRLFGPFCRDFFVPWESLSVFESSLFSHVTLQFGNPAVGRLRIPAHTANRLAHGAAERWPEPGLLPEETRPNRLRRLLIQWALFSCLGALFFTFAPMLLAPNASRQPVLVGILLPAVVFGLATIVRFFSQKG